MLSRIFFNHHDKTSAVGPGTTPNGLIAANMFSVQTPASTVNSVLTVAATQKGNLEEGAALATALEANGIQSVMELEKLSDGDWDKLSVSMGFKAAIKVELAKMHITSSAFDNIEDMPERLKRFLMIPGLDGKEPKRLEDFSAMFLGILTVPPADRQLLMLMLCEMLVLVSGLYLQIPLAVRRTEVATLKGWDVRPSLDDGMDALAGLSFIILALVTYMTVMFALYIAAGSWRGGFRNYESAMSNFGVLLLTFILGGMAPLFILVVWQLLTVAGSPVPFIGALILCQLLIIPLGHFQFKYVLDALPLEVYHAPRWSRKMFALMVPQLGSRFSDVALKPAAERRAAELRARFGIEELVR